MTKLAVILLLVAVLGVVAISAANYPRPPPVRPIRPFIPPRPPHPRNRRDVAEKPSVDVPKPLVHVPLKPGRPQIQILPATVPPAYKLLKQ